LLFRLVSPIYVFKISIFGALTPQIWGKSFRPQKANSCMERDILSLQWSRSDALCDLCASRWYQKKERKLIKKETLLWQTACSPRPPTWSDRNKVLHVGQASRDSSKFQVSSESKSVNPLMGTGNYSTTSNYMKLIARPGTSSLYQM